MFHRPAKKTIPVTKQNLTPILSADILLAGAGKSELIAKIQEISTFDKTRFATFVIPLLKKLAYNCQGLPETTNYYFAQTGGLFDHALSRTKNAVELFQQYLIMENSTLSEKQLLWMYALLSASLLKGIGKLQLDYKIELFNADRQAVQIWNPLLKPIFGQFYTYEFNQEGSSELRLHINLLLAKMLMPENGFAWIASDSEVLKAWLSLIHEDWPATGSLGSILIYADSLSLNQHFKELLQKYLENQHEHGARIGNFMDQTPENILQKERMLGIQFMQWLEQSLAEGSLTINKDPLFLVRDGILMSSEIFKAFLREFPACKQWQIVKRGFLALGMHKIGIDGDVTARFEISHQHESINGVILTDYAKALPNEMNIYNPHTDEVQKISATQLIQTVQNPGINQIITPNSVPLQHLGANGQWQNVALPESAFLQSIPGTRRGT